jgi:hypothetical protein
MIANSAFVSKTIQGQALQEMSVDQARTQNEWFILGFIY